MIIYDLPDLWDAKSRATIELAAQVVGTALMPYTGLDAAASFDAVYGTIHVRFTPTLKTNAQAKWGVIRFAKPEVISIPLVIHELGHLFGVRAKNRPTKQLWDDRYILDTSWASSWKGMHPPSLEGYNVVEKFCNAWEVEMLNMYADNLEGNELRAWMSAHMGEWCAVAMGGKI
jgi:hypothetical protein